MLSNLPTQNDPNVLVGFETSDDAGIYRIAPDLALVQTVDFFTPLVDDPFTFGQIAATNALSDVYAMGGRPVSSLALVCFPPNGDLSTLEQIMCGGLSKMTEAECTVVGGHSVRDEEMKFGYAVTGVIDPMQVRTNARSIPGDVLILTKPIGTGVITTALKQGKAEDAWVDAAVRSMTTLNNKAGNIATACAGVHAMTDITGFGLMGHGREMAVGSGVTLVIEAAVVPQIAGAMHAVRLGAVPGGLISNRDFAECMVADAEGARIDEDLRKLLYDPQTSGGLLISVSAAEGAELLGSLRSAGVPAAKVGDVVTLQVGGPAIILK